MSNKLISLTFYKTDVSPPSRATMIVVHLLKLTCSIKEVNLPRREHYTEEFLEINPLHTVPVLQDADLTITDSHAIITYLVSKYGGKDHENFYPKDLRIRAMVDQRLYFNASVLFPRLKTVIYSLVMRGEELSVEQRSNIIECYEVLEKYLSKQQFLAADYITLADISCVTTLSSLHCIVPVGIHFKKLHNWWARLKQEKWYQMYNEPGLLMFKGFINNFLK